MFPRHKARYRILFLDNVGLFKVKSQGSGSVLRSTLEAIEENIPYANRKGTHLVMTDMSEKVVEKRA